MRRRPCLRQAIAGLLSTAALLCSSAAAVAEQARPPSAGSAPAAAVDRSAAQTATPHLRAVALAPHIVELMFAAGAGDALVARVDGSDFPPAAQSITSLGDGLRLSAESLLLLRPDVVLAWQAGPVRLIEPLLARHGVALVFSDPKRLDDIPEAIEHLGARFGTATVAAAKAVALRDKIDALSRQYADQSPVRVFVQLGTAPIYSLGAESIVNDALRVCGAVNVLGNSRLAAPQVSIEGVIAAAPDAILTGTAEGQPDGPTQRFWSAHGWPGVGTPGGDRFIALPADALYRPTPRLIDATETLCQRIDAIRHAL